MKICLFTEIHEKGGLDTFLINLINEWPEPDDYFILLCNENHPGLELISQSIKVNLTIKTYRNFYSNISRYNLSIINFLIKILYRLIELIVIYPSHIIFLRSLFKKIDCEKLIIVNGGYPGSLLCRAAPLSWKIAGKSSKPLFNFHGVCIPYKPYSFYEVFFDWVVKKFTHKIISVSYFCIQSLSKRSILDLPSNSFIYNGIKDYDFKSKKVLNEDKYCVVLARLDENKGHFFAINSFELVVKEHPNINLRIYGDGSYFQREKLKKYIETKGIQNNVKIFSHKSNVASILYNAKLLLVPTQSFEAFNITIIEAMSMKVPIIATNIGGIPEVMLNSSAGYVVEINEVNFASKIIEIIKDNNLALKLGDNGRKHFLKNFTAKKMCKKYYNSMENYD